MIFGKKSFVTLVPVSLLSADDDVSLSCHETITFTTHGEFGFLFNLEAVVDRWQGPISVAIFTPGN